MLLLLIVFSGYAIIRTAVPPWWVLASFSGVCGPQSHLVRQWMMCVSHDEDTALPSNTGAHKAGVDSWQVADVIGMVCHFMYGMSDT